MGHLEGGPEAMGPIGAVLPVSGKVIVPETISIPLFIG